MTNNFAHVKYLTYIIITMLTYSCASIRDTAYTHNVNWQNKENENIYNFQVHYGYEKIPIHEKKITRPNETKGRLITAEIPEYAIVDWENSKKKKLSAKVFLKKRIREEDLAAKRLIIKFEVFEDKLSCFIVRRTKPAEYIRREIEVKQLGW